MSGWKLMPREPSEAMILAGREMSKKHGRPHGLGNWLSQHELSPIWRDMHQAAPSPPDEVLERIIMAYEQGMIDRGYRARAVADKDAIPAMRAALAAADGEQASISTTQQVD